MSNAAQVEALFFAALELGSAVERAAYLDSACGSDAELRRQVEKLLRAHPRVGDFLRTPAVEQFATAPEPGDATQELDAPTDGPGALPAERKGHIQAQGEGGRSLDEGDGGLAFLQPATQPGSLGRIGHYEVLEVLGRGGFGIVLRALDEALERVVALKVLAPQLAVTSPARKRFLREARLSARVRHENVVQVYAVEEQPLPYLVMEFIPGETLQQRLDRTGPLPVLEVLHLGRQIAGGLAAAHATGLIHRDIKPANILLERGCVSAPSVAHVKISDFGLARAADDASSSQSGLVAGTPMYMAPEQAQGEALDHRADLFSLGSVLYTMCTGRPPFRAKSALSVLKRVAEETPRPIREIIPEVPQWLCDLIGRLHAKKPEDRFASAQEVADLLTRHLAEAREEGGPRKEETKQKNDSSSSFRGRRWAAVAGALLLLLGCLGFTEASGVTNVRGTVIRLFSPEGTLVVEVDDPGVSIKLDGSDLVITGAGAREIRLKPGRYTVEARKDGKIVSRELVTVTRNGRQVVRVSQEPVTAPTTAVEKKDPDRRAADHVLSLGGAVKVNGQDREIRAAADLPREPFRLTMVELGQNKHVTDAGLAVFKDCKNLTRLSLWQTNVGDAGLVHVKECNLVAHLYLGTTRVTDAGLAHLDGLTNLVSLDLLSTKVTGVGLACLKRCHRLDNLSLAHTGMTDAGLAHLAGCKNLTTLWLTDTKVTDAGLAHLTGLNHLALLELRETKVTAKGVEKLAKALPGCRIVHDGGIVEPKAAFAPFTDADVKRIAALPAEQQVEEVRKELMRRNPGFDGKVRHKIEGDQVTELHVLTDHVTSIAPVRALKGLIYLDCRGTYRNKGKLSDLSPLKGTTIRRLDCSSTQVADLTPLAGVPLTFLHFNHNPVRTLAPLKGMPLVELGCAETEVADLSPLKGMKLQVLGAQLLAVKDLTPLRGMPLRVLDLYHTTGVTSIGPLQGMPLEILNLQDVPVSDLSPLGGMTTLRNLLLAGNALSDLSPLTGLKLTDLTVREKQVTDLAPLKGMPLVKLEIFGTSVTDVRPLQGMPLQEIRLCPGNIAQGLNVLRDMKSLRTVGTSAEQAWPAAEFWTRYEKGEFMK
jgi:serine/threonine protein kinase/Leucine-rich repeat (LRR) protein